MTWKNEPQRHALASEGVKTSFGKSKYRDMKEQLSRDPDVEEYVDIKPPKELYPINRKGKIDRGRQYLKLFWWCDYNDAWHWFPFEEIFEDAKKLIWRRMRSFIDDYIHKIYEEKSYLSDVELKIYNYIDLYDWDDYSSEEKSYIIDRIEENSKDVNVKSGIIMFMDIFKHLIQNDIDDLSTLDKIHFTEELIHAEHQTGNLWNIYSIPELREEFEDKYL